MVNASTDHKLIKIGVFYDGNYFAHVSNYYNYEHERKSRLSISGLHEFIRKKTSEVEQEDVRFCQIVDAHYFRGRLSSYEANERNKLLAERVFDDILMNEGVVTHYLPLRTRDGRIEEKGVDVWLALEAYEVAIYKKFDVMALVACDGDYVPLVRKLNTLGIRVMVLGWDFEFQDERTNKYRKTVTSTELLKEVTYPIMMNELIDNKINRNDSLITSLFVQKEQRQFFPRVNVENLPTSTDESRIGMRMDSTIHTLKGGYGFIDFPPNNLYFHYTGLLEGDFHDLNEGDFVEFTIAKNERNQEIAVEVKKK
jgi:uncharacterized LabA/DUF88 family protein/cold shock CspA family protein